MLTITRKVKEKIFDELCKDEYSEVDVHLPGCCGGVVTKAKTGLMKTYEQLSFNRQVNGSLNDDGQYIESTV